MEKKQMIKEWAEENGVAAGTARAWKKRGLLVEDGEGGWKLLARQKGEKRGVEQANVERIEELEREAAEEKEVVRGLAKAITRQGEQIEVVRRELRRILGWQKEVREDFAKLLERIVELERVAHEPKPVVGAEEFERFKLEIIERLGELDQRTLGMRVFGDEEANQLELPKYQGVPCRVGWAKQIEAGEKVGGFIEEEQKDGD